MYDADTPLDEIVFTLVSDRLSIEEIETGFFSDSARELVRYGYDHGDIK